MSHRRRWTRLVLPAYILLLLASHLVQRLGSPAETLPSAPADATFIDIPVPHATGPDPVRTIRLAFIDRGPVSSPLPPIILLHGSPGQASDFLFRRHPETPSFLDHLGTHQRRVLAVDLPGFGRSQTWIPDYSSRAAARALVSLLDALDLDRAHFVCWSNSGAVGINLADLAPDRMASLTLLAAIGAQQTEGSGSYWFEHAKYLVGLPLAVGLPELLPHFGLLGSTGQRHAFIRSFLDNDQRPLSGIMAHTRVPTLILHGRHDFLIADWAAEYHHHIMPSSRLVMLDASHFLPFFQPQESASFILAHAQRHDTPGVQPLTDSENLAPRVERAGPARWIDYLGSHLRRWGPITQILLILLLARWKPESATLLAALFVAPGNLDFGVAFAGLLPGRLWRGPELPDQRRNFPWIASQTAWTLVALALASVGAGLTDPLARQAGGWLLIPVFVSGVLLLRLVRHLWTWTGRRRIQAAIARALHHEWWPMLVFYTPVWLSIPIMLLRRRGRLVFTATNPGIENGGGFVGESKSGILSRFPSDEPTVLHARLIDGSQPGAARAALDLLATDPALGGFPVVLKPDAGQRGVGVTLARSPDDVRAYFARQPGPALLQRFHPGPCECGVFWMRKPAHLDPRPVHQRDGFIFSVNRKLFQHLEGDGTSTIRRLIWAHPRYRCQARLFLARFADQLDEVLPAGQRLLLSFAGNHAQGTCFVDGPELITPAFEAEINRIARSFRDDGFDFGRFDLRYENDELLAQGRGFAILELNGLTSESTNMYDPNRSLRWAWSILLAQWRHADRIGLERAAAGTRPLRLVDFLRLVLG
ncbi:MAG: alpha/beta fold hydrolase [Phycisphaerales bacterium]|nr:alpha/beta fold hydrolase [Phycisphaerales bacterium]